MAYKMPKYNKKFKLINDDGTSNEVGPDMILISMEHLL